MTTSPDHRRQPHPCMPVPLATIRTIETAALLALADHATGAADVQWRAELTDMARVSRALADQGVGPEADDLAGRALHELDGGRPLTARQARTRALRRVAHWYARGAAELLRIGGGAAELRQLSAVAAALRARVLQAPMQHQASTTPPAR